jgi:N-acyl-D-aspartate/D-glutamate deacylase
VSSPSLRHIEGKTVAEIARERGTDGVDTMLDVGLEDGLETDFSFSSYNVDEQAVAEMLTNPGVLIGLGDGGAHLSLFCDAGYPTYVLGHWVREKQAISLEDAVQRMTKHPAAVMGIKDRGIVAEGFAADLVIFDPSTVGSAKLPEKRYDLPGGGKRLIMQSTGIISTIVNGKVVYADGKFSGALPGQVLRS